jgi:dTDP-4-amino-4,6-dideoxygalactose transaminase
VNSASDPAAIRFNRAFLSSRELEYMAQAVAAGHISGAGPFSRRCQVLLEQITGARAALLTTSCTHALEMAAMLLDIGAGDEVILPSFTFVSTANAFVLRGVTPVFVDVRPDTFNLDERLVERAITSRTRAIVPVHYAGVGCEMEALNEIARRRGIPIVEDNAHGLFGRYRDRPLGSFGVMATLSFHETKNVTCGEGGALLINDERLIARAEIIREKGTERSRLFRGEVDKYTWCDLGSSYVLSDLLAAFLLAQLESAERIQARRREIWHFYADGLADWARTLDVVLPHVPDHCSQAYHMFFVLLPNVEVRRALIAHLKARGITSVFHYLPLHLSPMGQRFGGRPGDCPITERVSDRLLRLPFHGCLKDADLARVVEAVRTFSLAAVSA